MTTAKSKSESAFTFEIDPRFEAMLLLRSESRTRYEMLHSLNEKKLCEKYEQAKERNVPKR
jgi:hypothetical protein